LTMARNACLDKLRKRRRRRETPQLAEPAQAVPDAADPIEAEETLAALRDCLMQLDERDRSLIILTVAQGQSHRAAAEILDWPAADHTITRRLKSIKDALARCLKKKGISDANSP